MNKIQYVKINESNYENIHVKCPSCGEMNIFNRATDIGDVSPVIGSEVKCLNKKCRIIFGIYGDLINNQYEMLLFDCDKLIEERHYSYCILNLIQSYEMYFSLYLQIELIFKHYSNDKTLNKSDFRNMMIEFTKKTKGKSFYEMRAMLLNYFVFTKILLKRNIESLQESTIFLRQISINNPSEDTLSLINPPELSSLLIKLLKICLHETRNKIIHKSGYRPKLEEAKSALEETQKIIYGLLPFLGNSTDHIILYLPPKAILIINETDSL